MAGNDRLIFPVEFDLESAVKRATGNADQFLRRLQTAINARPLAVDLKIPNAGTGSIDEITKRMQELVKQWNGLEEAERIVSKVTGEYTKEAKNIIAEYTRLVGATKSYAQTLQQIAAAADKAANAEIRANEKAQAELDKRIAKSRQLVTMLNAEETSIAAVAAKQEYWQDMANKSDAGSKRHEYAIEQLRRLDATYNQLKADMQRDLGKDAISKAFDTWRTGGETTLKQVQDKIKAINILLAATSKGSQWDKLASDAARLNGVLDQMKTKQREAIVGDDAAYQKWLAQKDKEVQAQEQAEQRKTNATRQAIAKQNAEYRAEEEKRYQEYWNEKQREVQANEQAEAKKRAAQQQSAHEARSAAHKQAQEAYQTAQALRAQEDVISNLTKKLQIYNQQIQGQKVGTTEWNNTALNIRRVTEELEKANQRMRDFQQTAFKGLSGGFTSGKVAELTNLRQQIEDIDKKFNMLYQNGRATNADGSYKTRVLDMLKERKKLEEDINKLLKTAADAQIEREKEILRIQEQRKAKAQAIADKKKAETQQTQANIAKLKEERRILNQQESSVKAITDKLSIMQRRLQTAKLGSGEFEKVAKEVERLTKKLEAAQKEIDRLTGKSTEGSRRQVSAAKQVREEFRKQDTYVSRLIKRLAVYAGFSQINNFLTRVREVTAQFELQRVSLGAILQDQVKANQLFSEIKQFALKSPVKILDLTKYTKQLAAYKIGYDELFETTKKLTDVSVGLGVSMDRVVLAYGQVRATGHLRASEIRQFTEMGVPIVEELAAKLTKMNGELVTAAQVMDMVSKRAISFQMVKEVFDDMTSAGGIFYNMQEKQGNTLYGMWAKLGDAASVMYDEIGNTGWVNNSMKTLIQASTDLMKNWKALAATMVFPVAPMAAVALLIKKGAQVKTAAEAKAIAATQARIKAEEYLNSVTQNGTAQQIRQAKATLAKATADEKAARAANIHALGQSKLAAGATSVWKTFVSGFKVAAVITLVTTLIYEIWKAINASSRLKDKLDDIWSETSVLREQSVRNFEQLVSAATDPSKTVREQKLALDELNRTYKEMLPQEALKIENLKALEGNYTTLTDAVREYIAVQQQEKAINTINEEEGSIQTKAQRQLRSVMQNKGKLSTLALSDAEIERFFRQFEKTSLDTTKTIKEQFVEAFRLAGLQGAEEIWKVVKNKQQNWFAIGPGIFGTEDEQVRAIAAIGALSESLARQQSQITATRESYSELTESVGTYADALHSYDEQLKVLLIPDDNTFLTTQQNKNTTAKKMVDVVKAAMEGVGIAWDKGWVDMVDSVDADNLFHLTSLKFEEIIKAIDPNKYPDLVLYVENFKKRYEAMIPSDSMVQQIQFKLMSIADATGVGMDKMQRFLWDGSTKIDEHIKVLGDQIDSYKAKLKAMQTTLANQGLLGSILNFALKGQIEDTTKLIEALEKQMEFEKTYAVNKDKDKGRKSDTRLQLLQEINQTLEKINKEYDDLSKKEGKVNALADIKKQFEDTLEYTNKIGKKFGLHFDYPTEFKSLQEYRREILKVMHSLKDLKGGEKAILQFQTMIDKADSDELQRQIEKQLKETAEKLSRTKIAREFYNKILGQTGDIQLAARISTAIYGDDGHGLQKQLADQIRGYFRNENIKVDIPIDVIGKNDSINYKRLGEFAEEMKEKLGEEPYKAVKKIAEEGQKEIAKTWESYFKDIQKAEDYAQKRVRLAQTTADKIAAIRRDMAANPELKESGEKLIAGLIDKEMKEAAKLEWDAFKGTPLYVQMFEDLEHASTSTLEMMRSRLEALSRTWGSALDPTQLKEMQSRMNDITEQLRTRNPWKALKEAYAEYKTATDSVTAEGAVRNTGKAATDFHEATEMYGKDSAQAKEAQKELEARERIAEIARQITAEQGKQVRGQKALTLAQQKAFDQAKIARGQLDITNAELIAAKGKAEKEGRNPANDPEVLAAQARLEAAEEEVNLTQRVSEILDENAKKSKTLKESFASAAQTVTQYMQIGSDLARAIADTMEAVGADEIDVQYFNDIADALGDITAGLQGIIDSALSLNVAGIISNAIGVIPNMVKGFVGLFSAGKVRKANKEIRRQQELLEQLEYSYTRLEKAAEKAFGGDYVSNTNAQKRNMEAQIAAYEKQLAAENSKGKKKDKEKVKEYQETIRDTKDALAELEGQVAENMLGSTLQDAARDTARAWLDAYKQIGSAGAETTQAMKEQFQDMVENMVVEGALAKVMERALEPMFTMIDNMGEQDFYSESFWKNVAAKAEQGAKDADYGAQTMMKFLEQAGISVRDLGGDLTGISRDIASASEESINGLAQGINTQNFYISQIHANVAQIAASMGATDGTALPSVDYTPLIQQSLENQGQMIRYQAETLAECRNIAARCQNQVDMLRRVIIPSGAKTAISSISVRIS